MTFIAKKAYKYEDTMFFVKLKDSKTNAKQVEVWNGHSHTAVPDPALAVPDDVDRDDVDHEAEPVFRKLPSPRGGMLPPIGKEESQSVAAPPP